MAEETELLGRYKEINEERQKLYAHYSPKMLLEAEDYKEANVSDANSLAGSIQKNSCINFDLVVCASGKERKSTGEIEVDEVEGKQQHEEAIGSEGALADYILSSQRKRISINIAPNKKQELNVIYIADEFKPLELNIKVGEHSEASIFEWFAGTSHVAVLNKIEAGSDSKAEINIAHNESEKSRIAALGLINAFHDAKLRVNSAYAGGLSTFSTFFADAKEPRSSIELNNAILGNADQRFDIGSVIVNSEQETSSLARSGAALSDRSYCSVKDFAKIEKNAKNASSYVEEKGLLQGNSYFVPLPDMSVDTKDVLEATHSASTTPLDSKTMFYLMTRGISETAAKQSLFLAFIMKYASFVENQKTKEIIATILRNKLAENRIEQAPKLSAANLWQVTK
ncbi:MAG: SufB/SufD family protein [Candidatus Micrarchaeia archaeon]